MRCPHCGASNPISAEWCSLCLERFDASEGASAEGDEGGGEPVVPVSAADPELPSEVAQATDPERTGAPGASLPQTPEGSAFTVTEEGIRWTCSRCDHSNALELQFCEVCGTSFAQAMSPPVERPQRDPGTAALVSLFLPGAGHAYLGLWPQALTRGIVSFWVLTVMLAGIIQGDVPGATLLAVTFGLIALLLWAAAAHDAYREARGETARVLLKGRTFLYLVLALLFLLFVLLLGAGISARG